VASDSATASSHQGASTAEVEQGGRAHRASGSRGARSGRRDPASGSECRGREEAEPKSASRFRRAGGSDGSAAER
jgi:hypothetical protein